ESIVAHVCIAAVERCAPARVPEMLIGSINAPGRSQLDAGRIPKGNTAAIDAVRENAESSGLTILLPPVAVGVLHQVAPCTMRVDGLQLQVVTLADKWRVQPQASHDRPTPFIIRVTASFRINEGC